MKKLTATKTTLAALALATLAACGGGGGSSTTTPPVTYTATTACATGPALTSTVSQAAADALVPASCPALTPAQLAGITVNRSAAGALTLTGLPAGVVWTSRSVTFTLANTTVNGTIDAAGNITPTSTLAAGTWTVTFTGQPALAPAVTNLTLASVVVPVVCTAPTMLNTQSNVCVTPPAATGYTWLPGSNVFARNVGLKTMGPVSQLSASTINLGDAGYLVDEASGVFINTMSNITLGTRALYPGDANRQIYWKSYKKNGQNRTCHKSIFSDNNHSVNYNSSFDNFFCGAIGDVHDWVVGVGNGLVYHNSTIGTCGNIWLNFGTGFWEVQLYRDTAQPTGSQVVLGTPNPAYGCP